MYFVLGDPGHLCRADHGLSEFAGRKRYINCRVRISPHLGALGLVHNGGSSWRAGQVLHRPAEKMLDEPVRLADRFLEIGCA